MLKFIHIFVKLKKRTTNKNFNLKKQPSNSMSYSAESVWIDCLSFIKDNIKPQAYKTWFEPIKPVKLSGEALTIQVPSKFFYEWLEEHYIKLLRVALVRQLGNDAKLIYDVKMENNYSSNRPQIVKIPSSNRDPLKPQKVTVPLESNKSYQKEFDILLL